MAFDNCLQSNLSVFDACCGSNENMHRNSFARLFTEFSGDDKRLGVSALPRFLTSLFHRHFTDNECTALARKVASHTVYEARQGIFGERLEQTLSFEEVEYIYEICRSRGYILR